MMFAPPSTKDRKRIAPGDLLITNDAGAWAGRVMRVLEVDAHCGNSSDICVTPLDARVNEERVRVHGSFFRKLILTKPQRAFLEGANESTPPHERAVRFDWSGIGASGPTLKCARTLGKLGFVEYIDHGVSEDDDREVPIFAITDAGRAALAPGVAERPK